MEYIHVIWHHSFPDEPTDIYMEVDEERWEVRKIEVYRDGRIGYASEVESTLPTELSTVQIPTIEEIAEDIESSARAISKEDFAKMWTKFVKNE